MYVAIAGNIGSGKSLVAERLSQRLEWVNVPIENEGGNPYIDDFYIDMKRWSFELQIYFLAQRWKTLKRVIQSNEDCIMDRTIYEDAEIFAKNLYNINLLESREFESYYELYGQVIEKIDSPALLVYLRASSEKLLENIKKRGRSYETTIDKEYIKSLNELYENWTFSYSTSPILVIDIDSEDIFSSDEGVLNGVVDRICEVINTIKK